MKLKPDWRHADDVQRVTAFAEAVPADPEINYRVSANVGDLMAAALAAAGSYAIRIGGSVACETDYLAASGATFPADVPIADLVAFNHATLIDDMDEYHEMRRYAAIAGFFRRSRHAT